MDGDEGGAWRDSSQNSSQFQLLFTKLPLRNATGVVVLVHEPLRLVTWAARKNGLRDEITRESKNLRVGEPIFMDFANY